MSRGPEAAFWKRVREAWDGHAVRIEASDGEADPGTPDCVLSVDWRGGWIELKVWPDDVSPGQLAWHVDALEREAYAMVLSELPSGNVWLGPATEYHAMVQSNKLLPGSTKPKGSSLQAALRVVRCALTRKRR